MQNHYESFRALPESFNGRAGVEPRTPPKPPDCPTPTPSHVGSMCLHHAHNNKPCRHLVPKASLLLLSFFLFFLESNLAGIACRYTLPPPQLKKGRSGLVEGPTKSAVMPDTATTTTVCSRNSTIVFYCPSLRFGHNPG